MVRRKLYVELDTIQKVKEFCDINYRFSGDINLSEGIYTVNAKSILGVFSLDLTKILLVSLSAESEEELDSLQREYHALGVLVRNGVSG